MPAEEQLEDVVFEVEAVLFALVVGEHVRAVHVGVVAALVLVGVVVDGGGEGRRVVVLAVALGGVGFVGALVVLGGWVSV